MALNREFGDVGRAFRGIRDIDQIVRDFFKSSRGQQTDADINWLPDIDVRDTGREYDVTVDLPGVSKDKLSVDVCGDSLVISGERPRDEQENQRVIYHERPKGRFMRTIPLPTGVQTDKVDAKLEQGILQVKIPRSEESASKRIEIQ
ncbi:5641_t:CDS:2 [Ambispora leptoticha]|uniref:5641_t:CDS:1 n=1 Tax=Ambispora leptoticha TaxID=144679 RepID=A0A9N9CPN7_9GLOM|nr:5641_t:CDS:2 [Ambispora leptoticha]